MYEGATDYLRSQGFVEVTEDSDSEEIGALLRAGSTFIAQDGLLLEHQASERALCHRLAIYLEQELPPADYARSVDCEYNRVGTPGAEDRVKRFRRSCQCFDEEQERRRGGVFPDIIVHERGEQRNNSLVVEAKLASALSEESLRVDLCKLHTYVAELEYRHAAFVLLEDRAGSPALRVFSLVPSADAGVPARV
jgi:hypothetical protein